MRMFPAEFSALLNAHGQEFLERRPKVPLRRTRGTPIVLYKDVIDRDTANGCVRLLDRHIFPSLHVLSDAIPRDAISKMKRNYSELLPKTFSIQTSCLWNRRHGAYEPAEKIGLISMMKSESLHRFAENVTGLGLDRPTLQVICYCAGDYSGPHNDHHPEHPRYRDGYVDFHVMFGNDAVAHQWLVYEQNGHFREIHDVNLQGGIAIYRLPFWHYTTPLAAKPGRERQARRWLLLASFAIAKR